MLSRRDAFVGSCPAVKLGQRIGRFGGGIERYFGSECPGYEHLIAGDVVAIDSAREILRPLPHFPTIDVCPVKIRLEIAVTTGDIADFNREEHMAIV